MEAFELLQKLAATPGKNDKQAILIAALTTGHTEFFIGARLCLSFGTTFGVKKVPAIAFVDLRPDDLGTFSFDDFLVLVGRLQRRELTGNAARDALETAASSCHGPSWNDFYRRVLQKDLRCGVDEKSINKAIATVAKTIKSVKEFEIPVYACQLAHNGSDKAHAKKIRGVVYLDGKRDGIRLQTVLNKEDGTVTQYTRNGAINENFTAIRVSLVEVMDSLPYSVVLDGEMIANSFQELMTQVNRQSDVDASDARLALFDIIPLKDFTKGRCETTQRDRHAQLVELEMSGLLRSATGGKVFVIPKIEIDLDTREGQQTFTEVNNRFLSEGLEGVMVKKPDAPYECKRTDAWLKLKPKFSFSLAVIDVEAGKPDGKRRDVMGALVVRGVDEGKLIQSNVGTGFSDAQLEDFWNRREELIGMIAEIEADAVTLESGGEVYSLRFPRYKGFRGTVPGEKL